MPCYDKKLEASREDFYNDVYSTRDVDLVITSIEMEKVFQDRQIDLKTVSEGTLDSELSYCAVDGSNDLMSHRGGGSGGYLEHAFTHAANALFQMEPGQNLQYKMLRNRDFQEVTLTVNGDSKLKFAFAYGFRNIQNVVQKIKRKRCDYHFIEVMACPSGCTNGGGQIRAETREEAQQLLREVNTLYDSLPERRPEEVERVVNLHQRLVGEAEKGGKGLLHTEYHEIEKTVNALNIKW